MDEGITSYAPSTTSAGQKILIIILGALLFGFGWHIRGSGTSDPTIVMLMLVLFIGIIFSPRNKNNFLIFGLIVSIFRFMRRGWGTFVSQAGIPGLWSGALQSPTEEYYVEVAWWQGYFWLFIVGLAWSGLVALILGGYYFSKKKYSYIDLIIFIGLYVIGFFFSILIAEALIPIISPEAYYDIYLTGVSERNYISMRENMAFVFAIIPVFSYIIIRKKDYFFIGITLIIMIIFGIGLSLADLWQVIGRNNLEWGLPAWSLWEYFSGFIIGGLLMLMFFLISDKRWKESDYEVGYYPVDTWVKKLIYFVIAHFGLFLFGIQESFVGLINSSARVLEMDIELSTFHGIIIILLIDIPLYYLYVKDYYGKNFKKKPFDEKCLIILTLIIPYAYFCYAFQFILNGTLFNFEVAYIVTWLDTISMVIVEIALIILIIRRRGR